MTDDTEQLASEDSPRCATIAVPIEVKAEIEAIRRIVNGVNNRLDKLYELIDAPGQIQGPKSF